MDSRLENLYRIPDHIVEQDLYLLDLSEQYAVLEEPVRALAQSLPTEQRRIMAAFLDIRDELEFQSVKVAMKFGKYLK